MSLDGEIDFSWYIFKAKKDFVKGVSFMNQKKKVKKPIALWTLTGISAVLLVGFSVGYVATLNAADVINKALNIDPTKKIEVGDNADAEGSQYFKSDYDTKEELLSSDADVAERLTEEGSVLLKNQNDALPLSSSSKVTLLGHSSDNFIVCGTGSAKIDATGAPTLKEALESRGVSVNPMVWDFYEKNKNNYKSNPDKDSNSIRNSDSGLTTYLVNEIPYSKLQSDGVTASFSQYNDAAVVVVSRIGGEMYDIPNSVNHEGDGNETVNGSGNSLELTKNEIELIQKAKENFSKVIVLLNSANPMECDFLTSGDSKVDACLWVGYTGKMGLNGVADLLVGNTTPSGRLVDTYCNDNLTSPAMVNMYSAEWKNSAQWGKDMVSNGLDGNKYFNAYQEGIYVGYRYYETRYEDFVCNRSGVGSYDYKSTVAYPFGYGLSYTTFDYANLKFEENSKDDTIDVSLTVTNSGTKKGKEVVEVYFQSPYTDYDMANGIEKASVELCGFAKTKELNPGESQEIKISVERSELATYDSKVTKSYLLEAGDYYLTLGNNAHDALNNIISKKGEGRSERITSIASDKAGGDSTKVYSLHVSENDDSAYSIGYNKEKITNHFDEASLSYYGEEDMKYLSRKDWEGTWPTVVEISLNQKMHDEMTGIKDYMPTESSRALPKMDQKNGKSLIHLKDKTYDDSDWELLLDQLSYKDMCRLVGLGYHGTKSIASVDKPETKDENGPQGFSGNLTDIFGTSETMMAYTDENIMGATWNTEFMEEVGRHIGNDGLTLGYSGLYGPAMNTHRTPYGGRNFGYYSEDGFLAGMIAASEVRGIQSKGVYVFIKHFALNDQETNCRTISVFANEQSIREIYLKPFELAVKKGHAHNVMTAFSRVGVIWSSAHKGLMSDVLRGEWGMDGFAVSDYTSSGAPTTTHSRTTYDPYFAVNAGTDTFDSSLESAQYTHLYHLNYEKDPELVWNMREACHRILYVVCNSAGMNGISDGTKVITVMGWWQMALIDGMIYSGILFVIFLVFSIIKQHKYHTALSSLTMDVKVKDDKKGDK